MSYVITHMPYTYTHHSLRYAEEQCIPDMPFATHPMSGCTCTFHDEQTQHTSACSCVVYAQCAHDHEFAQRNPLSSLKGRFRPQASEAQKAAFTEFKLT
mmetsp:Transcript_26400/g.46309  ORF Transcript_26400/g.46309 Transcript_26400/m.46309 type:complete len:99 (-) Transcript_26400:95-391(-)